MEQKSKFVLIFFFSSILLFLPQNTLVSANSDSVIQSSGATKAPTKILHTDTGETWLIPTGEFVYKTGSESTKRVFDEATKEWKPHIYEDLGNDNYQIQSGNIGTIFSGQTITHYDTKLTEKKTVEKLKFLKTEGGKYVEIPLTFVDRTMVILQKQVLETVSNYEVTDTIETVRIIENWNSDEGTIKIYYDFTEGEPLKHTFLVTPKNDGIFRLYHVFETNQNITVESVGAGNALDTEQIRIGISQNSIKVVKDGQLLVDDVQTYFLKKSQHTDVFRHVSILDQVDGSLLFGEFVSPNRGNIAWQKFIGLNIDSSKNSALLEFQYGDWVADAGETFELDPDTYSSNNPTIDGYVLTNTGSGASCPTAAFQTQTIGGSTFLNLPNSGFSVDCRRPFIEWDISSIPDGASVTDTVFKYHVATVQNPRNCDYQEIDVRPSTATAEEIWDAISSGTTFLNNDATCITTGTNKSVDLGATADASVEAQLASGWFALGMRYDNETRDSFGPNNIRFITEEGEEGEEPTPAPTLEVKYIASVSVTEKAFTLAATADLSKQKNNIGTNYTDVYNGAFEPDFNLINFTGYTKVRILSGWDYSPADTGNQQMRWVDANNNTRVLYESSTFTIDQDPNDSGWLDLPTWATNETTVEWQGKSTVIADDPIAKYFRIFLR